MDMRQYAAVLMLAFVLAGCATMRSDTLHASLADVSIVEAGLIEQRYGLKLRFMNAGESDITIDGLAYEIEINGHSFARGVSDRVVTIPRFGEAVVEVSAIGNLAGILRQFAEFQSGRFRVEYRLTGRTGSRSTFGAQSFDVQGRISLPQVFGDS
jgi:LEA14-like dessication related protein